MASIVPVAFEDERAHALWDEQQAEMAELYGEPDIHPTLSPDGLIVSLLALAADGTPVGTVLARWSHYHPDEPGAAEVKRLYVDPAHRGKRIARELMSDLERRLVAAGATHVVLETGLRQPEAIRVYESLGYRPMPNFGPYQDEDESYCMTLDLPSSVLVINGTMGAGKTTTAAAVHDALTARGVRNAFIDADALCQAEPAPADDRFNQRLLFANLAAVAPAYRAAGFGTVVIARVVEDPSDRARYAAAFAGPAGHASVSIVRVTASEATRVARITAREPEGYWRDMGLARTVELEAVLERLALDDAVVSTDGASRGEVAAAVLDAAGWRLPTDP